MLRIRLRRVGKKKQPMYRIVVADSRAPRDGAFVESIGYYHPLNNPSTIVLDETRARHWLDHGAQPSERVSKILHIQGIAELPPKLVTRMELGAKRAEEAKAEKAKAAKAEAASAPASVAEAKAPEAPAEEAAAPEPAADAPAEESPTEPASEAPAAEEPAAE
jgi:small subunit ribosomal protein S16